MWKLKLYKTFLFLLVALAIKTFVITIPDATARESNPEKISLVLQWHTQCQFAGYYTALEKGWYKKEGIDLTIKPGATDLNPIYLVQSGLADFGTKWLADFLSAKDKGYALVSMAQILQSNGLVMIAKAKSGIKEPRDFVGKRLGIWYFGNEVQFYTLMNQLKIPLDKMDIKALKWSIEPFLNNKFDVTTAMIYNEYLRVLDNGYKKEEINIIDFKTYGINFPGQVIFTHKKTLNNRPDLCEKFTRASVRGWAYAMDHPEEATDIVLKYDKTEKLKKERQLRQMNEIIKLIKFGDRPLGYHDPQQVQFVMQSMLRNKVISEPVDLSEAYTNDIWKKATRTTPLRE